MLRSQLVSLQGRVLGVLLVWAAACSPTPEEVPLPDTTPPSISILAPRENSVVVDTVQVTIQASDDQGVARVTLLVDGSTEESRYAPPWAFFWATGVLADSSVHCLQAEAVDQAGNLSLSAERCVSVLHNSPPVVQIIWPPDGLWIDLDRPCEVWLCQAEDPEEGSLGGDQITWYLDGLALVQQGLSITPSSLSEGPHELAIVASDGWGRVARAEVSITAFHYPGATDPTRIMETFLYALRARDATVAAACLSDAFTLVSPGAGFRQGSSGKDWKAQALQALLEDSCLISFSVEGHFNPPEVFTARGTTYAKLEIRDLNVHVVNRLGPVGEGLETARAYRVEFSGARIFLHPRSPIDAGAEWQILAWWDLHRATWLNAMDFSWTDLLREVLSQTGTRLSTTREEPGADARIWPTRGGLRNQDTKR